jgi:hypothetical protein
LRGFFYRLQSSADAIQPFTNEPGGFIQATNSSFVRVDPFVGSQKFYRLVRALTP